MMIGRYLKNKVIWGLMVLIFGVQVFIGFMLPKNEIAFDSTLISPDLLIHFMVKDEPSPVAKIDLDRVQKLYQTFKHSNNTSTLIECILVQFQVLIVAKHNDDHFVEQDWVEQLMDKRKVYRLRSSYESDHISIRWQPVYLQLLTTLKYTLWLEAHHLKPYPYHEINLATIFLQNTRVFSDIWLFAWMVSLTILFKAKREKEDTFFFVLPKQKRRWLIKSIGSQFILSSLIWLIPFVVVGLCFGLGQFQYPVAVNLDWQIVPADLVNQDIGWVMGLSYVNQDLIETVHRFIPLWQFNLLVIASLGLTCLAVNQLCTLLARWIKGKGLLVAISFLVSFVCFHFMKPTQALLAEVSQSYVQIVCLLVGLNLLLWLVNYLVHQYKSQI